jgi:hypothetical protein
VRARLFQVQVRQQEKQEMEKQETEKLPGPVMPAEKRQGWRGKLAGRLLRD